MEYKIFSYAVDVNKIKQAFNSKNDALYNEILKAHNFEQYAYGILDEDIEIEEALKDMIYGLPYKTECPHVYTYAFMVLCKHLGETLPYPIEEKDKYGTDLMMETILSDFHVNFEVREDLLNDLNDLNLPFALTWPMYGVMDWENVSKQYQLIKDIKIEQSDIDQLNSTGNEEDEEKANAYKDIKEIVSNFGFATENHLGVVTFAI